MRRPSLVFHDYVTAWQPYGIQSLRLVVPHYIVECPKQADPVMRQSVQSAFARRFKLLH